MCPKWILFKSWAMFYMYFLSGLVACQHQTEGCCGFPSKFPPVYVRVHSLEYLISISYKVDKRC